MQCPIVVDTLGIYHEMIQSNLPPHGSSAHTQTQDSCHRHMCVCEHSCLYSHIVVPHPSCWDIVVPHPSCWEEKLKQHIQKHIPNKKVEFYHAGLGDDSRSATQQQFVIGNIDILVATNASFGVGINLPLVLKVVVIGTPMSIQTISQAIGRGGRKGQQYYVDFYIKEADIIKNRIMLNKEAIGMSLTYKKYALDSFDAVQYLVANSAADKSMCLLNIILQGVNATSTFLAVPYSDLQDFKKKNSTVRPYNRAKWNSEARKWYLPPFAQNQAVAQWNTHKNTTDVLLETSECGKCSNCRNRNNISRFL